jgi:hypothetical protein
MRILARVAFALSIGPAAVAAASGCSGSSSSPPSGALDATAADTSAPDAAIRDAGAPDATDAATGRDGLFAFDGSFDALAVQPIDGVGTITTSIPGPVAQAGVKSNFLAFVADRPTLCASGVLRQGETVVSIDALSANPTFVPDRFIVTSEAVPTAVTLEVTRFDEACGVAGQYVAVSGSVIVTRVTPMNVAGTFDVALSGDSGTLQGAFDVPLCSADAAQTCAP